MNFQAIIFDLDGLLVESEPVWLQAETDYVASLGYVYTDDLRASIVGLRLDAMMDLWRDYYGLEQSMDELISGLTDLFVSMIPGQVRAKPGAGELVNFVYAQRIPTAIASSSPQIVIDTTVESQGWGDIFSCRCSADDVALGKPAPDVYLAAARTLNVAPADCLALEDSPAGSRAAVAAGMTCYAVPDPTHSTNAAFKDITPHVYNDLYQVLADLRARE